MTDIVKRESSVLASAQIMGPDQFDNAFRLAKALHASGQFKDINTAEQAFGRMLIGADMGLTPTQALMSIDVVRGNVQVRGKRLLAWVRQSENYDYDVIERTDEKGTLRFFEKSKRTGQWKACEPDISFTLAEAKDKGLVEPKSAWAKWPANMCLWRCASIGVNLFCPDIVGGVPVYTEADTFESTAVELTAGEGDGSEPGWHGIAPDQTAALESLLERAEALNFPGLGDRATVQMRMNGQSASAVQEYIDAGEEQLRACESVPEAEVVDGQQTLEPEA